MMRTVDILLVSSDAAEVERIRSALEHTVAEHAHSLQVVEDGQGALEFLRREGCHAGAPRPDLIILDPGEPGSGEENCWNFLQERSAERSFRAIPVVVFSGSIAQESIARSYQLQANSYVYKPDDEGEYRSTIATIKRFWLGTVRLPRKEFSLA